MAIEVLNNIKDIKGKSDLYANVPIFATQEYADYLLESKGIKTIWFIERTEEQITFIIPFAIEKKYLFKKGYFLTAVNNLGISTIDKEKLFLEEVITIIKKRKLCDWIKQSPNWALFQEIPSYSIFCEFGTYKTDLEKNTETELYNKLHHEARRLIKKAIGNSIIIKSGPGLIEDCMKVFAAAAIGGNHTLLTRGEIEKILYKLPDNIKIYVSYNNNIPQCCTIFYLNQYCLYAVYAGSIPSPAVGANHILYWQALIDAKQNGIKNFDFIGGRIAPVKGSKQEGIQRFKKDFGGSFEKGYLWKMPISKSKYLLYKFLIKTISFVKNQNYQGDIIDQEIKKNKVKKSVLTIDYELFLGEKTGTVKECMIEPTAKLASLLKTDNSKMTIFWDILHYYKLLQYEKDIPELYDDRLLIEKQIIELAKSGHDIQLHLHPHWLDARFINGSWVFQYDRFRLNKLKNEDKKDDINSIIGCVTISKNILENLIRSVIHDYKITAIRAGGYLIEPFNEISDALIANEINVDSSVCPGLYKKIGMNSYDFSYYPLKQKYNFVITPEIMVPDGKFIEIPITTIKLSLFRILYFKVLKKIKYSSLEKEKKGLGIGDFHHNSITTKIKRPFSILSEPRRVQFTTDFNFHEKFNYMYKKAPDYATMILHPKLLTSHTLSIIEEYITANKIHFISIKDYLHNN